jgi:hypothetical protein
MISDMPDTKEASRRAFSNLFIRNLKKSKYKISAKQIRYDFDSPSNVSRIIRKVTKYNLFLCEKWLGKNKKHEMGMIIINDISF